MASELANKCRIAGEAVQSDLDAKPAPTGGISLFDSETYPEVQAVKEEFEKTQPDCTWQRGVYWRKNFIDPSPKQDINFIVLRSDSKEPGGIIYSKDGMFPRGVYLAFVAT